MTRADGTVGGRKAATKKGAEKGAPAAAKKSVSLALQGGGSHGALTWGMLDALLEDGRLEFDGISGASAGALNGTLMTYGLLTGGREKAREILADFWRGVANSSIFGQVPQNWLQSFMPPGVEGPMNAGLDFFARSFSPYQFNPMNYNPLRALLERAVDYKAIRESTRYRLFIGATNVLRGTMRVFETKEITADTLLASACIPLLFQAVTIDGESYWDGGYLGNPTLYPLVRHCLSQDILILQINPAQRRDLPTDPITIADRVNEISFNASLQSEIEAIELINHLLRSRKLLKDDEGLKEMFLHKISDDSHMANYGAATKMSTDWGLLSDLRDFGYHTAKEWLGRNFDAIGKASTYNPEPQPGHTKRVAAAYRGQA